MNRRNSASKPRRIVYSSFHSFHSPHGVGVFLGKKPFDINCFHKMTTEETTIPLIELSASIFEDDSTGKQMRELCRRVVDALQTSGFLLVTSPFLPLELQQSAIHVTQEIFQAQQVERTTTSSQESTASSSVPDNNKIIDIPENPCDKICRPPRCQSTSRS
jgi:non-haem dioxygenase in morphine synthesis N-terminal